MWRSGWFTTSKILHSFKFEIIQVLFSSPTIIKIKLTATRTFLSVCFFSTFSKHLCFCLDNILLVLYHIPSYQIWYMRRTHIPRGRTHISRRRTHIPRRRTHIPRGRSLVTRIYACMSNNLKLKKLPFVQQVENSKVGRM